MPVDRLELARLAHEDRSPGSRPRRSGGRAEAGAWPGRSERRGTRPRPSRGRPGRAPPPAPPAATPSIWMPVSRSTSSATLCQLIAHASLPRGRRAHRASAISDRGEDEVGPTLGDDAGHPVDDRGGLVLGDRQPTGCRWIAAAPSAPSFPMPVSTTPTASAPQAPRQACEQHVDRRTVGRLGIAVEGKPLRLGSRLRCAPSGANQTPGVARSPSPARPNGDRELPVEPFGEALDEARGHVLDDEQRDREVRGELGEDRLQRGRPTGRRADADCPRGAPGAARRASAGGAGAMCATGLPTRMLDSRRSRLRIAWAQMSSSTIEAQPVLRPGPRGLPPPAPRRPARTPWRRCR